MTINQLQQLTFAKSQFSQIQKMYFFKSRELLEIEEHLKNTEIRIQQLQKNSRAVLRNSKYKSNETTETTETN